VSLFSQTDIANKAATMINVLKKRTEIEEYLTNLEVERQPEIEARKIDLNNTNIAQTDRIKKDAIQSPLNKELPKTMAINEAAIIKPAVQPIEKDAYQFNEADTQYAAVILTKVDRMFVNEAKNAFNRFNQEKFYGERIALNIVPLNDEVQLILFGPFENAELATNFVDQTKPSTSSRILPWLTADKYSFSIISPSNLELLLKKKNIEAYQKMLHELLPGKF
jgi:hypothetical protein